MAYPLISLDSWDLTPKVTWKPVRMHPEQKVNSIKMWYDSNTLFTFFMSEQLLISGQNQNKPNQKNSKQRNPTLTLRQLRTDDFLNGNQAPNSSSCLFLEDYLSVSWSLATGPNMWLYGGPSVVMGTNKNDRQPMLLLVFSLFPIPGMQKYIFLLLFGKKIATTSPRCL